jgi:hypothetical protein
MSDELRKDIAEIGKAIASLAKTMEAAFGDTASVKTDQKDVKVGDPYCGKLGYAFNITAIRKHGKIVHKTSIGGMLRSLYEHGGRYHWLTDEKTAEAPTIPTIKEALDQRLFKRGDRFHYRDDIQAHRGILALPKTVSFLKYNDVRSNSVWVQYEDNSTGDWLISEYKKVTRGDQVIAQEPVAELPTPEDFIKSGKLKIDDVIVYTPNPNRFTEKVWGIYHNNEDTIINTHGIFREPIEKITRNGQVVAARHFWEDR